MHESTRTTERRRGDGFASRSCFGMLAGGVLLLGACGGDNEVPEGGTADVTPPTIAATPVLTPTVTPTIAANQRIYVVEAGDTGLAIPLDFGISLAELAEANGITEEELDQLQIGQELTIPNATP